MSSLSSPLAALIHRVSHLGPEATKFGVVGLTGVGVQIVAFNVLRYAGPAHRGILEHKPITAQVIAIGLATVITYLGNRYWTYHHRARGNVARELPVFVLLNGIAISIGALCLAFSHYLLGRTSPLADNISGNVVGLGLGTLFRFGTYRKFVFTGETRIPPEDPASAGTDEH